MDPPWSVSKRSKAFLISRTTSSGVPDLTNGDGSKAPLATVFGASLMLDFPADWVVLAGGWVVCGAGLLWVVVFLLIVIRSFI